MKHVCDHHCRCPECFGRCYYRPESPNIRGEHACVDPQCGWSESQGRRRREKCYVEGCIGEACNGFQLCYEHQADAVDEYLDRYDAAHAKPVDRPRGQRRIDLDA